jgi:predicted amidohydrolase YtcJ
MARFLDAAADVILYNAHIHTLDSAQPRATAVAIRDVRFVGIGDETDLRGLANGRTERINLHGRTIVPGLNDTHNHMSRVGLGLNRPG